MIDIRKNIMWIAGCGSYGYGKLLMCDTASWTDEDYKRFDEADESQKWETAIAIEQGLEDGEVVILENLGS